MRKQRDSTSPTGQSSVGMSEGSGGEILRLSRTRLMLAAIALTEIFLMCSDQPRKALPEALFLRRVAVCQD